MAVQKKYHLDVKILTRLLFTIYMPVFVFVQMYQIDISVEILKETLIFLVLLHILLYLLTKLYIKVKGIEKEKAAAIINSVLYYNCGNYGIPLIMLVFPGNSLAFSIQIIVIVFQTILPFTHGIITINAGKKPLKEICLDLAKLPFLYAIPLGYLFQYLNIKIPNPILIPLNYVYDGFIAIALLTLGFQLANISWRFSFNKVLITNILRLIISPIIALFIVTLFGITGVTAQVLIISSAVPTALNVVLLAIEYDNEPEFASQVVLSTTILSVITMTLVIVLVRLI
ncbi:AEC family transporter [Desulforamulus aquiferis]|uniref:AEC family transporter n=2 Tax=Desulforamulus aquiferis TaxID=1397668 RepID=A0AAW7Z6F4_9FIRM|nr:AEC family transporter [Desulforamulus aquiferis]